MPVVALVGRSDELADQAVEAGVASCVRKPFTPTQVVEAVVDALAGYDPQVEALRKESRSAIAQLVRVLGYPESWADELERRAFANGRTWRVTAPAAVDEGADGRYGRES